MTPEPSSLLFVVQVREATFTARSDPLSAAMALKVARAWRSHGDGNVFISRQDGGRSWALADFPSRTD